MVHIHAWPMFSPVPITMPIIKLQHQIMSYPPLIKCHYDAKFERFYLEITPNTEMCLIVSTLSRYFLVSWTRLSLAIISQWESLIKFVSYAFMLHNWNISTSCVPHTSVEFRWQDLIGCTCPETAIHCSTWLVSFLGLPTIQFLIACSIAKRRGKAWSILSREWCFVYLGRQRGGRGPRSRKWAWGLIL